jgi:hypothetical protein
MDAVGVGMPRQQASQFFSALDKLLAQLIQAIPRPTTTRRPVLVAIQIKPQPSFLG